MIDESPILQLTCIRLLSIYLSSPREIELLPTGAEICVGHLVGVLEHIAR
jgi:hypothetical protein